MAQGKKPQPIRKVALLGNVAVYLVTHAPAGWGLAACAYILLSGKKWATIDNGWPGPTGARIWDDAVETLGLKWPDLENIWLTHAHPDHLGQALYLAKRSDLVPVMHPDAEAELIRAKRVSADGAAEYSAYLRCAGVSLGKDSRVPNMFRSYDDLAVPETFLPLREGKSVYFAGERLETLLTPGHAPGHLSFWHEETRTVFSGDMVISNGWPPVVCLPGWPRDPMGLYLGALERLRALEARLFLAGHGEPLAVPNKRLDETIAFHRSAIGRVGESLWDEPLTAAELAVRSSQRGVTFEKLSVLGKGQILGEMLAYVHYLIAQGTVAELRDGRSETVRYCLNR